MRNKLRTFSVMALGVLLTIALVSSGAVAEEGASNVVELEEGENPDDLIVNDFWEYEISPENIGDDYSASITVDGSEESFSGPLNDSNNDEETLTLHVSDTDLDLDEDSELLIEVENTTSSTTIIDTEQSVAYVVDGYSEVVSESATVDVFESDGGLFFGDDRDDLTATQSFNFSFTEMEQDERQAVFSMEGDTSDVLDNRAEDLESGEVIEVRSSVNGLTTPIYSEETGENADEYEYVAYHDSDNDVIVVEDENDLETLQLDIDTSADYGFFEQLSLPDVGSFTIDQLVDLGEHEIVSEDDGETQE